MGLNPVDASPASTPPDELVVLGGTVIIGSVSGVVSIGSGVFGVTVSLVVSTVLSAVVVSGTSVVALSVSAVVSVVTGASPLLPTPTHLSAPSESARSSPSLDSLVSFSSALVWASV